MKIHITPPPHLGQDRKKTKFAWFPVKITKDAVWVWLERYTAHQVYTKLELTCYGCAGYVDSDRVEKWVTVKLQARYPHKSEYPSVQW